MTIDIFSDELLTLAEAAKSLPRLNGSRPISVKTLYRWGNRGCGGVRLETAKIGRTTVTTRAALQKFMEDRTAADRPGPGLSANVERRALKAEQELIRRGL